MIAGVFILALLLVSIIDIALSSVNKISLRRLLENPKVQSTPALARLVEKRDEVLLSVHILIQLLTVSGAVFLFGSFGLRQIPYIAGMPGTIALMFVLILIVRQLIPRIVAVRHPDLVLLYLLPVLRFVHLIMLPFSSVLTAVMNYFQKWEEPAEPEKEEEKSDEDIQAFIDAGEEEGILESDEGEMIQSIVHFGNKVAREVMTPRTQIIAVSTGSPIDKLVQLVVANGHSRIPVYRDDLDNIEGIIHERDLLQVVTQRGTVDSLRSFMKPVTFVPETKPVDDLLQEMRDNGDPIVIVVDEYGGVSGLVTMRDLIEEIVGDMSDESKGDGDAIVEEGNDVFVVPGSLELSALNARLGLPFVSETECTTVAGAVVELFGRLPGVGERIENNGIQIEVLDADRRRVHRLRLRILAPRHMAG